MVRCVRPRRECSLSSQIVESIDEDEGCLLRWSPSRSVTMRWVWPSTSSFFAAAHDEGSAGSCRPCTHLLSRSERLRPYESSYFLAKEPSSEQLASMFTDCEALLPATPRQTMLEAVAVEKLETVEFGP